MNMVRGFWVSSARKRICNYLGISDLLFWSIGELASWCSKSIQNLHVVASKISWDQKLRLNVAWRLSNQSRRYNRISVIKKLNLILSKLISLDSCINVNWIPIDNLTVIAILNIIPWISFSSQSMLINKSSSLHTIPALACDWVSSVTKLRSGLSCVHESDTFDINSCRTVRVKQTRNCIKNEWIKVPISFVITGETLSVYRYFNFKDVRLGVLWGLAFN